LDYNKPFFPKRGIFSTQKSRAINRSKAEFTRMNGDNVRIQ